MIKKLGGISLMICLLGIGTLSYSISWSFKAKATSFRPSDEYFREIYGNGICYGGELDVGLTRNIFLWAGVDYKSKKGKMTLTQEETKIRILPISAGAGYQFHLGAVNPYLGAGIGYFDYKEESPLGAVKKGNMGFVGQGGVLLVVGPLLIDFQAGYSYCKVKPAEVDADLGGLCLGVGLGFEF